jgi:arylsulfatase A-like enzyme
MLVAALAIVMTACNGDEEPRPDDDDTQDLTQPLVVLITVDALNRSFLGAANDWDTTPNIDALIAEGTTLQDVLVTRGLTSPSLASLLTGRYPRGHGIRSNRADWEGALTTLPERFQQAGFVTYGYSANMCSFIDFGIDHRYCTWLAEMPDVASQQDGDERLVDQLIADLDTRDTDSPMFIWLHLMDPHDPYTLTEPWYSEFHPEPYDGDFDPDDPEDRDDVMFGDFDLDELDRRHLDAVYASSVRSTDGLVGRFLDGLRERDLYDDAVIVFGADHGEVLARHEDYFYHGCSTHNAELAVTYAVRAPGTIPAGATLAGWVGEVDIAPTLAELAGLAPDESLPGRSLVPELQLGAVAADHPRYFERGTRTAGLISGRYKYVLNPEGDFIDCFPYAEAGVPFPGDPEALYDLLDDPDETVNLADDPPAVMSALHIELCAWILEDTWLDPEVDASNALVLNCQG